MLIPMTPSPERPMTHFEAHQAPIFRPMTIAFLLASGLALQACGGGELSSMRADQLAVDEVAARRTANSFSLPTSASDKTTGTDIPESTDVASGSDVSTTSDSEAVAGSSALVLSTVESSLTETSISTAPSPDNTILLASATTVMTDAPVAVAVPSSALQLPAFTVLVNGNATTSTYLDTLRTRSGNWQLHSLGQHQDFHAYLMRLESKPEFARVMACRRPFTRESGDTVDLSILNSDVTVSSPAGSWSWKLGVAQGACRVVQNMEPVAPNAQWLRDAVSERRLPSYSRTRAWFPSTLKPLAVDTRRGPYDPSSLGPVVGAATAVPSSNSNYIGVTSSQGGEYVSSRGFLHDVDAKVVDAALSEEDSRINATWDQFVQYTWYSLAQPQGAVWSEKLHTTVDPQFPQTGETAWENPVWTAPRPEIRSLTEVTGWKRDVHHMENTGFIHWILTEDPVAGLLVQRQAAYALAAFAEGYRKNTDKSYKVLTDQERGIYNALSTLWKSRDVSRRVRSLAGTMIWDAARSQKQALDAIAFLDAKMVAPMRNALPGASKEYVRKIAGVVMSSTGQEAMMTPTGQVTMSVASNFMLPQYGKEPLYLWSLDGSATVKSWFEIAAGFVATRLVDVGGAAGVDGCVGVRGSSFPLKVAGTAPAFSDKAGWAAWVNTQCPSANRANFDGAYIHTSTQMEGLLLLARAAGVAGLNPAIDRVQALKAATTTPRSLHLQWHKHLAGPAN